MPGSLEDAAARNRSLPAFTFENVDDRRGTSDCRVGVIVSLYNAAGKLLNFLHALQNQTVFRQGRAELILVDSGSPGREYEVFRTWATAAGLPVVYARSQEAAKRSFRPGTAASPSLRPTWRSWASMSRAAGRLRSVGRRT